MSAAKDVTPVEAAEEAAPVDLREIVWAVCEDIPHAGQMTRQTLEESDGWSEVDESHDKVRAVLGSPPISPVRASSKEK